MLLPFTGYKTYIQLMYFVPFCDFLLIDEVFLTYIFKHQNKPHNRFITNDYETYLRVQIFNTFIQRIYKNTPFHLKYHRCYLWCYFLIFTSKKPSKLGTFQLTLCPQRSQVQILSHRLKIEAVLLYRFYFSFTQHYVYLFL